MILGQIDISSAAGQTINKVCCQSDVKTIVEIGTWNGMGSTKCVELAIKNTEKTAISIEADLNKYIEAKNNLKNSKINLLYGKITDEFLDLDSLSSEFFQTIPKTLNKRG